MGRGRQKAKQTKVARQLKYFSPDTDYDALQRELSKSPGVPDEPVETPDEEEESEESEDYSDEYADWSSEPKR